MKKFKHNLQYCHSGPCKNAMWRWEGNNIICINDPAGRNIIDIATKGDCPKGYFTLPLAQIPAALPEPAKPIEPVPRENWPLWAKGVAMLYRQGDAGIGDIVQRMAAQLGGEKFKEWATKLGIPCGCSNRQAAMNQQYPFPTH